MYSTICQKGKRLVWIVFIRVVRRKIIFKIELDPHVLTLQSYEGEESLRR